MKTLYFDSAATTPCCEEALKAFDRFALEEFGNPASAHGLGQRSARALRDARLFFADSFRIDPEQVIFTGSGSESDNLALWGVVSPHLIAKKMARPRIVVSAVDHPAVRKTAVLLAGWGVEVILAPVGENARLDPDRLLELITADTVLISIHQVNNVTGALYPVEEIAARIKAVHPHVVFHSDAVQGFGKLAPLRLPVDLVSISAHKIEGPKGVGALLVLNKNLLSRLRPLIFGGDQENGLRSGTPNVGLITAFEIAARRMLQKKSLFLEHCNVLRETLRTELLARKLMIPGDASSTVLWNSPADALPSIVNLSVPGFASGPLLRLLEERGCLVSAGSACHSVKAEPDPVLSAMGLPLAAQLSAIRISFSDSLTTDDVRTLAQALEDSIARMRLLGASQPGRSPRR